MPLKEKPHIVMVVARGEIVRNFFYSATLPQLSRHARITLLSSIDNGEVIEFVRPYVERIVPLKDYRENRLVIYLREMIHYAHFRWLWFKPAQSYWGRITSQARTWTAKFKWAWQRGWARLLANRHILEWLTQWDERLSWHMRPTHDFERIFSELKPDLVFNGSHIHADLADLPMRIAHRMGISTATFVFSWDNLYTRSRIFVPYTWYLMWNEEMRTELLRQYPTIASKQLIVTGTPQFDYHFDPANMISRDELCEQIGIDSERPFLLYTTAQYPHFLDEHKFILAIIEYLKAFNQGPKPQLVVRTYAKGNSPEILDLARQKIPDVFFPEVLWNEQWLMPLHADLPIYTGMLHHCAMGINVASTVSLELMMLGKPVINLGLEPPGSALQKHDRLARHVDYEHYVPVVQSGGVMVARTMDDLRAMLYRGLTQPQADQEAQQRFLKQMFGDTLDGLSGERVAQALIQIACNNAHDSP